MKAETIRKVVLGTPRSCDHVELHVEIGVLRELMGDEQSGGEEGMATRVVLDESEASS